ncbi:MAG TPA: DUF418 domain-containing protein [Sphingomonas sp.]|nr:DUF418 domain-containing protein [Sphingomonas sp.]
MGDVTAPSSRRLDMVDALRGYALMGLFLVHMEEYFELYWSNPHPAFTTDIVFGLFMGKTFSLLALCFGFSFFVMMDGGRRRGQPFAARFAWRLVLLATIGLVHGLVYRGDIIIVLALIGFLLIPLDYIRSNRLLVAIATFCFLQPYLLVWVAAGYAGQPWALAPPRHWQDPAMALYLTGSLRDAFLANIGPGQVNKWDFFIETGRCAQILGLFVTGLVLGRIGFFADPGRFRRGGWIALAASLAVIGLLWFVRLPESIAGKPYGVWIGHILADWFDLASMALSVLIFIALWQTRARRLLAFLVPAGRMTLTLYVLQSLIFVPLFYPFGAGLYARITQPQSLALGLASFTTMTKLAAWWFRSFHYGPLEWLWRCGTRMSLDIPFRRRAPLPAST